MMPKIESPIGVKNFAGQSMREIDVPDESGYVPPGHAHNHQQERNYVLDEAALREFNARMNPVSAPPPLREVSEIEKQVQEAKRAKKLGIERLSDGAKRRIEMLLGMTRLTRVVDIEGNKYILQALKAKEIREAVTAAAEFNNTVQFPFEYRKQFLGRALVQVANVDIEQFLNSNELDARLDFVEDMDHSLALRLYNEYIILAQESEKRYAIKSTEDVKEVGEDLKK